MQRHIFVLVALAALSMPLQAEEQVWHCEMKGFAQTKAEGVTTYKKEKFKIKVSPETVVFGNGGFFHNVQYPISQWFNSEIWTVATKNTTIGFREGMFHFGSNTFEDAIAISAVCDDF